MTDPTPAVRRFRRLGVLDEAQELAGVGAVPVEIALEGVDGRRLDQS